MRWIFCCLPLLLALGCASTPKAGTAPMASCSCNVDGACSCEDGCSCSHD